MRFQLLVPGGKKAKAAVSPVIPGLIQAVLAAMSQAHEAQLCQLRQRRSAALLRRGATSRTTVSGTAAAAAFARHGTLLHGPGR